MRKETVFLFLFLVFDLLVVFVLMDVMYKEKSAATVQELEPQIEEVTLVEYEEADPFYKKRGITQALLQHLPSFDGESARINGSKQIVH